MAQSSQFTACTERSFFPRCWEFLNYQRHILLLFSIIVSIAYSTKSLLQLTAHFVEISRNGPELATDCGTLLSRVKKIH